MKKSEMDSEKVLETVRRYCRLSLIPGEDVNVIMNILSFEEANIDLLLDVLKKYEKYQTKESENEKSSKSKILRGEKKTVPLSDFRKMRLMRNYQVESFSSAVLSNIVSFKDGLEEIVKEQERRDVVDLFGLMEP